MIGWSVWPGLEMVAGELVEPVLELASAQGQGRRRVRGETTGGVAGMAEGEGKAEGASAARAAAGARAMGKATASRRARPGARASAELN